MNEPQLETALAHANAWLASFFGHGQIFGSDQERFQARHAVLSAERALAAARGQSYADVLDLGVQWDTGAPLPHIISDARRTVLLCRAYEPDPQWDGTYVNLRSPSDAAPSTFVEITFEGCVSTRFGPPDQDEICRHHLWGRGLTGYEALVVHNSEWDPDQSSVRRDDAQAKAPVRDLTHYFLGFHDESFEALAASATARLIRGTMRACLADVVSRMTSS